MPAEPTPTYRFTLAVHRDLVDSVGAAHKVYVGHASVDTTQRGADAISQANNVTDIVNTALRACRDDLAALRAGRKAAKRRA